MRPSLAKNAVSKTTMRRRKAQVVVARAARIRSIYRSVFAAVVSETVSLIILAWWTVMVMKSRVAVLWRRMSGQPSAHARVDSLASARVVGSSSSVAASKAAELVR